MKLPSKKALKAGPGAAERAADASCEAVWDLLSLYADQEVTGDEAAMVETHIAVCVDCDRDLQFMRRTQTSFSALPEVAPPPDLRAAILAATVRKPGMGRRLSVTIQRLLAPAPARYGFAAAAGMAGILVAVGIHRGMGPVGTLNENPAAYQPKTESAQVIPPLTVPPAVRDHLADPSTGLANTPRHAPSVASGAGDAQPLLTPIHRSHTSERLTPGGRVTIGNNGLRRAPVTSLVTTSPAPVLPGEMKVKPPVDRQPVPADEGTIHTADMVVMMDPMEKKLDPMPLDPPKEKSPEPAPATTVAPKLGRMILTSSSSPETVGQVASFADLKRALKNRDTDSAKAIEQSIKAKEIRVPVLRRTF